MTQPYKYFAFISYNSHDIEWGKRLQRKLENYKMSATLCSERGWKRKPINPIFFAPTDIQPGELSHELQERLKDSRNLIVICSPHSARSKWVAREIEYFHKLGRASNIYFFIVDGQPHSGQLDTECFNPIIHKLELPEILGANIHEKVFRWSLLNKERAYVQLISKLLDVEFDTIWQRHKRQLVGKIIGWVIGFIMVLISIITVYTISQPLDVKIQLTEATCHNPQLPSIQATELVLELQDEVKKQTILSIDSPVLFPNIPRKYLNQPVHISASIKDYYPLDTTIVLTENSELKIHRDPSIYGNINFQIWNDNAKGVPGVRIKIQGQTTVSDAQGNVSLFIPLEQQQVKYAILSSRPLSSDSIILPCGDNDILIIK